MLVDPGMIGEKTEGVHASMPEVLKNNLLTSIPAKEGMRSAEVSPKENIKTAFYSLLRASFPHVALPECKHDGSGHFLSFMGFTVCTGTRFDTQDAVEEWLFSRGMEILQEIYAIAQKSAWAEKIKKLKEYNTVKNNQNRKKNQATAIKEKAVHLKLYEKATRAEIGEGMQSHNPFLSGTTNLADLNIQTLSGWKSDMGQREINENEISIDAARRSTKEFKLAEEKHHLAGESAGCWVDDSNATISMNRKQRDLSTAECVSCDVPSGTASLSSTAALPSAATLAPAVREAAPLCSPTSLRVDKYMTNSFEADIDLLLKGKTLEDFNKQLANAQPSLKHSTKLPAKLPHKVADSRKTQSNVENRMEMSNADDIPAKNQLKAIVNRYSTGMHRFISIVRDFCLFYDVFAPEFEIVRENDVYRCTAIFCDINFVSSYQYNKTDAKDGSCSKIFDFLCTNWNAVFGYEKERNRRHTDAP